MIKAYINFWKLAFKPNGKSSRSDYWWAFLVNTLIRLIIIIAEVIVLSGEAMKLLSTATTAAEIQQMTQNFIAHPSSSALAFQIAGTIFSLLIMIPVTTLTARRLRDAGLPAGLAYPLPAIYLANALLQFMSLAALGSISFFAGVYALILLILCAKKAPDSEMDGRI